MIAIVSDYFLQPEHAQERESFLPKLNTASIGEITKIISMI